MKQILIIVNMLVCTLTLGAQSIFVSSFRLLESDLTANTFGTIEHDQNGEVAALIKVVTTETGFTFDGGSLGIVKTVQKPAEIWVYVPRGFKKITISHPKLGILRDYYLPMAIGSAKTYEMILATRSVKTSATSQATTPLFGEAEFNSVPSMADIYIDGKKVGQTPQLVSDLLVGQHEVRISKQGFGDYISTLNVKEGETAMLFANLEKLVVVYTVGDISFTMVRVDGGTFRMGDRGDQGIEDDAYQVALSPYYIGETEVTQALWKAVMGNNPSYSYKGNNMPVNYVSWDMCQDFIQKLNQMTGRKFRLPTEAEWEFAARGGNKSHGYKYSGSNNSDDVAWFGGIHNVKTKQANELGLYDMSGNVQEWVQDDWYGDHLSSEQTNPTGPPLGSRRVCRGGSVGFDIPVWEYVIYPANDNGRSESGLRLACDNNSTLTVRESETSMLTAKHEKPEVERTVAVSNLGTTSLSGNQVITVDNTSFTMIQVEGGTFTMGATSEQDLDKNEKPVHQVTLSPYYIGETEVTQALWEAVMGSNPSYSKGSNKPVEQVSWDDCQKFIQKLNQKTGRKFRLPTEAEWEFAARGGKNSKGYKYSGSNKLKDVAWFCDNSNGQTHDVKTKQANELGLYDMSGNVYEWCNDWFGSYFSSTQVNPTGPSSGQYRIFRGGSWSYDERDSRISKRGANDPDFHDDRLGLRLAF